VGVISSLHATFQKRLADSGCFTLQAAPINDAMERQAI
jgi:hypothetical protein